MSKFRDVIPFDHQMLIIDNYYKKEFSQPFMFISKFAESGCVNALASIMVWLGIPISIVQALREEFSSKSDVIRLMLEMFSVKGTMAALWMLANDAVVEVDLIGEVVHVTRGEFDLNVSGKDVRDLVEMLNLGVYYSFRDTIVALGVAYREYECSTGRASGLVVVARCQDCVAVQSEIIPLVVPLVEVCAIAGDEVLEAYIRAQTTTDGYLDGYCFPNHSAAIVPIVRNYLDIDAKIMCSRVSVGWHNMVALFMFHDGEQFRHRRGTQETLWFSNQYPIVDEDFYFRLESSIPLPNMWRFNKLGNYVKTKGSMVVGGVLEGEYFYPRKLLKSRACEAIEVPCSIAPIFYENFEKFRRTIGVNMTKSLIRRVGLVPVKTGVGNNYVFSKIRLEDYGEGMLDLFPRGRDIKRTNDLRSSARKLLFNLNGLNHRKSVYGQLHRRGLTSSNVDGRSFKVRDELT